MKHLLKCPQCALYTLKESCPLCQAKTFSPRPPKFSPVDKYGQYRREEKKILLQKKGLF